MLTYIQVLNTDGKTTYSVEKVFVINIKSGWKSGAKVTFPNEGNEGPGLLPADVVVIIEEKPHKNFSREGNNLIYTATVSLEKALTGFTLDIVSFRESEVWGHWNLHLITTLHIKSSTFTLL